MSILSDFEDRIAAAVEGIFAGAFRSPVQPAEIAKALAKAMDDRTAVGVGKVYAPHAYTVALSAEDDEGMGVFRPTLAGELATYLSSHAAGRGYSLASKPKITFTVHDDLRLGRFRVAATEGQPDEEIPAEADSRAPQPPKTASPVPAEPLEAPPAPPRPAPAAPAAPAAPTAAAPDSATVTVGGSDDRIPLTGDRILAGRLSSCDITLSDANVSREHAAFVREGAGWAIQDLDSTNGIYLNDERVDYARLRDGDVVSLGATRLVYHEPRG